MRKIDKVIIHCTATPEDRWVNTLDLYKWHVLERGWSDVGYHYLLTWTVRFSTAVQLNVLALTQKVKMKIVLVLLMLVA